MNLYPVFLFFVWLPVAAAHVEPPTNVVLECHNLHNVLSWSYDQFVPDLKFIVRVAGLLSHPTDVLVEPPALQANISFLSDPRDEYYVHVTAVVGQNKSAVAPPGGITFSYIYSSTVKQKCSMDFPPANMTTKDGTLHYSFTHPWLLYHHLYPRGSGPKLRKKKSQQLPELIYDIVITNQEEAHFRNQCEESVCEGEHPLDPSQKNPCVTMSGEMDKILLEPTKEACTMTINGTAHENNNSLYVFIGLGSLGFMAFAFVLFMVFRKKTKPSSTSPDAMNVSHRSRQWNFGVTPEPFSVPVVEPSSPTPLLTTENTEITSIGPSTTEDELRLRIGGTDHDEGVRDLDVDEENNEGSGYLGGGCLDDDDDEDMSPCTDIPSGYERRPVFVEMAPGEQAEGYRGSK
ncbi:uncharacterized protein V6R79_008041 [Siganus canaliculatus]